MCGCRSLLSTRAFVYEPQTRGLLRVTPYFSEELTLVTAIRSKPPKVQFAHGEKTNSNYLVRSPKAAQ